MLVSAVFVVLFTVAALLAGNLRGSGGTEKAASSTSSTAPGVAAAATDVEDAPAPTIMGPGRVQKGSTTMFATTTLLVTTTSSTTTTTLAPGGTLTVRGGPLALDPGGADSLLVANTGTAPLRWGVASSAAGVTARPTGGTLEPAETVTVRVTAAAGAPSGVATLTFLSGGGVRAVRVTVGSGDDREPLAASLSFVPEAPDCGTTVTATLTPSAALSSVQAQYSVGNSGSSRPLTFTAKGTQWTATIPAQPVATRVRVSATATGADGTSVTTAASYPVAGARC